VKATVALLVALGFVACVSAGSYGGHHMKGGYGQYGGYIGYRPQMYYVQQPLYYGVGAQGGGSGSGNIFGGSGNLSGGGYGGGYGLGGGSNTGSIIPLIIICKYIHRMI
jgi:hypothetical protein